MISKAYAIHNEDTAVNKGFVVLLYFWEMLTEITNNTSAISPEWKLSCSVASEVVVMTPTDVTGDDKPRIAMVAIFRLPYLTTRKCAPWRLTVSEFG